MSAQVERTTQISSSSHAPTVHTEEVLSSKYTPLLRVWSEVIMPFLVIRLLLFVVGIVTVYYILPLVNRNQPVFPGARLSHFPDMLFLMWDRFDSGFYLSIAHDGYWGPETLHGMSTWAFFPLYPLLIRLIASPFGSTMDTYRVIGIIISNSAALVAATYLYKLTTREFNHTIAARTIFYFALFPLSFYLSAIYPEALFIAFIVSCVYYTRLHRWWLAGLLGGLAALTRPQGTLLVIVIGWEYWQVLADHYAPLSPTTGIVAQMREWLRSRFLGLLRSLASWRTWLGFVALALVPTGFVLFCLYAKWKVGSFLAFEKVELYGWGRHFTNPLILLQNMITHPLPASPYDWNFYGLNVIVIFAFLLLLIPIFRRLPVIYGIFALAFCLMPITSGVPNGVARYYLEVFPAFMFLAWWSSQGSQEQQMRRHTLIVSSFAVLLSLGMTLFTLGVYSMQ